jgi:signal transduction histidine kinase
MYFGTKQGIVICREGSVDVPQSPAALAGAHVWSIHQATDGAMYFGTNSSGLLYMRGGFFTDGRLDTLDVSGGLSDNTIYGILEDDDGRLYLSTHRGVNIVDISRGVPSVRRLRHSDGLASDECNQGAAFKDSGGRLWFGTIRGVSCYDPSRDPPNPAPPQVHFTRIRLFDDDLALSAFTPRATFDHDENYFEFDFVGTNPAAPEKVVYQYRLSNIDRGWVETRHNFVQYRALPHDDYTFELRARNEWGYWSVPAALSFTIKPPFWKAWWFIVLIVLAAGGTIVFLVMNRVQHMLAIERLRTKIAADLHDDVGAGLTEISITGEVIAQKLPEESRVLVSGELGRIGGAARQLINSMSDIVWLVNPSRDSLHDLIARLGDSYKETLNAANVTFRVHNVDTLKNVRLAMERRQHVFLIFKEAINNALKYSGCSKISLEVELSGVRLKMKLADNGSGFDTAAPAAGNGLRNMAERAAKVGATVNIYSSPGGGTTVTFHGPIR